MLIDTHCHLHDREFFSTEEAKAALSRAHENGIEKIVCIGTDPDDSLAARDFAAAHDNVYWTYGIHPSGAKTIKRDFWNNKEDFLKKNFIVSPCEYRKVPGAASGETNKIFPDENLSVPEISLNRLIAIGEVGLDYHYDGYDRELQIRLLEEMLQLAKDQNLPVSFHVREAFGDFFGVIANFPEIKGVIHSFSDSKKVLRRLLNETDFYIGVNGLATYSTLPTPPIERILLETDAPFLAPIPFRGQINEPAYIKNIAEWLSAKLDLPFAEIADITTRNAEKLFHF